MMKTTEEAVVNHLKNCPLALILSAKHTAWMFLGSVRFLVTRWRLSEFGFDLVAEGESLINGLTGIHTNQSSQREQE